MEDRDLELKELLAEVRRIDVMSRRLVTNVLAGGYTSVFRGSGLEFDGVREYVEGDDPRSVDWNVTARVGRPFVKKYVDERELCIVFLLDLSASMGGGFGVWSARQTAARICACIAFSAARNNDRVGLIGASDGLDEYVPPAKGAGHALRVVRDCLALPGRGARTDLAPALSFAARVLPRHAILFVVSDFQTTGYQDALRLAARRHDVIAVRLLNPEVGEPGLPRGLLRLCDPESGRRVVVDGSSRRVRRAFGARAAAWRARTEEELRALGIDRMDVPISRAPDRDLVARPLLRFFRMRLARGGRG